jgi:hypothetical protein
MAKSKQDIFMEVLLDSNLEEVAKDLAARMVKPVKDYFDGGGFPKGRNVRPRKKFTLEGCLGGYQMEVEYRRSNKGTYVFHATENFMSISVLNPESREGRMADFDREARRLETEVADLVEHEMGHYYLGEMADAGECLYYTDPRGFAVYFEDPQEMVLHSKVVWNELMRSKPNLLDRPMRNIEFSVKRKVEELEWKVGVPGARFPKSLQKKYVSLIMKHYVKPVIERAKNEKVAAELVRVESDPGRNQITAKLLDDMGVTKAIVKKVMPYMKKIRDGVKKRDAKKIRAVVGRKVHGEFVDLVRMTSEQEEIFKSDYGKGRWAVFYEVEFTRNRETKGQVRGDYDPDTRAVKIKIDAESPAIMIENGFDELDKYLRLTDDAKIKAVVRHEVTHAIRDAYTGHLKRTTDRRKRDPKYDDYYRGERGHLDEEYEIDAIVNELEELSRHLGRRKWKEMGPSKIEKLLNMTLFPKVGDGAFFRWVKRLKREGLLTDGMMREWGLGEYGAQRAARDIERAKTEKVASELVRVARGLL